MRFQLSENVRTSLCLKRSYTLVFCCNFFTFLTYGASFYTNDPLTYQIARACFNFALLAYSIGLIIIIIYTIPVYRYKALDYFRKVSNFLKRNRIIPERHPASKRTNLNHVRNLEGQKIIFELAKEGELYFSQLNDSWK
uniref:Uncharacterized protein n=1 Tax=Panagrolaimus sp. PS1159 TaxID=55785 RepID=A0AC35G831_9BILA